MSDLKSRLIHGLTISRTYTDQLLDTFESPEDWLRRAAPEGNHALWIAGHLAVVDNAFISRIDESHSWTDRDEWKELFGKGSSPQDDLSRYPAPELVRDTMRERRGVLLELLDCCTDDDFLRALPPTAPAFMHDIASMFQMAAWHEGIHAGQLSVIHRQCGHKPLR